MCDLALVNQAAIFLQFLYDVLVGILPQQTIREDSDKQSHKGDSLQTDEGLDCNINWITEN